eukprot:jgi/Psemu1/25118/gm1.25118_g
MPEGTQTEGNHSPTAQGVTPDTSIDTSRTILGSTTICNLRDQLEELELYNRDILEYTEEQNTQLQTQNRLLYDYTEDSEDSDTDDKMPKKKDYPTLKDHLDETLVKPVAVPSSIDVYEFKKALANALAKVPSIKYIQGGGYAFLLETEAQYRARDPHVPFPKAPREPQELDSTIELTSDTYKLWKRSRALYVEWNKYDREALLITDRKFPNMLGDLKDPGSDAFPRGTTVLTAFQIMEKDLCTTAAQHQLTRELTKKMNALTYTPSPIGPKENFRQFTKYQHQINLLPETANVTAEQMIDYSQEAFARSKHDPITLHRVDKDWKKYRESEGKSGFTHYKKFWGQRLKELYSSYHNTTTTANLADVQADQRFTKLENKQRDLANVCQEIYSQVTETATAASTMTMSNQWETAMAVLQADVNRLKLADASRAKGPALLEWKQYKYYCHSCGVNLTHNGRSCYKRRNKAHHQEGATFDNQMGGATRNTDRWLKWNAYCYLCTQNETDSSATSADQNDIENEYSIHTGAGAYQIQAIPKLIRFYHAAAGYPTKERWARAIERGSFATWLGLTVQRVNRYLPLTEETTMGHLQMVRQGIQSTHKPNKSKNKTTADTEPPRVDQKKIHNVCVDIVATNEMQPTNHAGPGTKDEPKELIAWDLPGRYPVTSRRGHQYVFLMYDYDSNYIDVEPIQSRKSKDLLQGFTAC